MKNKKPEMTWMNDDIGMYYACEVDDYYEELLAESKEVWEREGESIKFILKQWDKDYENVPIQHINLHHKIMRVFKNLAKAEGW